MGMNADARVGKNGLRWPEDTICMLIQEVLGVPFENMGGSRCLRKFLNELNSFLAA